ncbi:MAG: MBL fold metallo-hydrolase [Synergistaceae bacterium]|nr:MBL fold metallo-hydrolase [Synergistaceae bacterium]
MYTIFMAIIAVFVLANAAFCSDSVSYKHIRNATAKISYAGSVFLIDPFLAEKGTYPGFVGTPNSEKRIPLIDMAEPVEAVVRDVDAVILTHTHLDHWDQAAQKILQKDIPFFVQNAGDARTIREQGFTNVMVVGKNTPFEKVLISKTGGQHGPDELYSVPARAEFAGDAMGFVLQSEGCPVLYVMGDTTWHPYVDVALEQYKPDIVVMNTGYAMVSGIEGSLIMGKDDVIHAYKTLPSKVKIIAVHMDAVNHTTVSSEEMRELVGKNKMEDRVFIPREGEVLMLSAKEAVK